MPYWALNESFIRFIWEWKSFRQPEGIFFLFHAEICEVILKCALGLSKGLFLNSFRCSFLIRSFHNSVQDSSFHILAFQKQKHGNSLMDSISAFHTSDFRGGFENVQHLFFGFPVISLIKGYSEAAIVDIISLALCQFMACKWESLWQNAL